MKVIYLKWRDAGELGGTNVSAKEVHPETLLESVGILLKEDDEYVVIAMDVHLKDGQPFDQFNTPGAIVKANIIERREINLSSARRWRKYE